MIKSEHEQPTILSILSTNYEQRTQIQHSKITHFLNKILKKYSYEQCHWISLLCNYFSELSQELLVSRLQIDPQSTVIHVEDQQNLKVQLKIYYEGANLPSLGYIIIISQQMITNSSLLCKQSVDEVIKVLRSFDYLSGVPKKRFYQILRNLDVNNFTFGKLVYTQNQPVNFQSRVYIVRKGNFTYLKREKSTHKNIELYTFSEGQIFGSEDYENSQKDHHNKKIREKRMFSVKCQSSQAVIYSFKIDFFNQYLRKACQNLLINNNIKLHKFLQQIYINAELNITKNAQFITQPIKRSLSEMINYKRPFNIPSNKQQSSQNSPNKKSALPNIKINSSILNQKKIFLKEQLKKSNHQYQQQKLILLKQYKCELVRQFKKSANNQLCKGQVLLNLMKSSFDYEKNKNKHSILKNNL